MGGVIGKRKADDLSWGAGGEVPQLKVSPSVHVPPMDSAGEPFYIHPWEIDPGQPRMKGLKRSHAFRHYVNLEKCESRWAQLLSDFQWTTMEQVLERHRAE